MSINGPMTSTLVETVNIDYEDFNESFLTCGTCLCLYDGTEHNPKLLSCSHTVCLLCLTRIAASSQHNNTGTFRCPICRELITIPRGGVVALPPSFLVNQLLDLMARQRRELVPKCAVHLNQELLFCESCDAVFCSACAGATHSWSSAPCEHTVVPFSIAIKRMVEILLYKANECIAKLTSAEESVNRELQRLDESRDTCYDSVNNTFSELSNMLELRRQQMLTAVSTAAAIKRKVLQEQQELIEAEKNKVQEECSRNEQQTSVRELTQAISRLDSRVDGTRDLAEPRENAFLACDFLTLDDLIPILDSLGRVRTTTTYPTLCTVTMEDPQVVLGLRSHITLRTVDYHGAARVTGGDPVQALLYHAGSPDQGSPGRLDNAVGTQCSVVDNDDGSYKVSFVCTRSGPHCVRVLVLGRPVRPDTLSFIAGPHNNPLSVWPCDLLRPAAITVCHHTNRLFVVDSANRRVRVVTLSDNSGGGSHQQQVNKVTDITNEGLDGGSCTGIACDSANSTLAIVDWRSRQVVFINIGDQLTDTTDTETSRDRFTHQDLIEPTAIARDDALRRWLVVDAGAGNKCVFVFDDNGELLFKVGENGSLNSISAVSVGRNSEIVIADNKILVYDSKGNSLRNMSAGDKGKGHYTCLTVDSANRIIAARTDKGRNIIQVFSLEEGNLISTIDSNEHKLKRPSGLAVTKDGYLIVVDLGNDSLKKYRYR